MENSGLQCSPAKATQIIEMPSDIESCKMFSNRIKMRTMSEEEFIENHASGTLRKNKRLGFYYKKQYLHERIAFEFGYGFNSIHESYFCWGSAITEGDCSPITEAGWHIDRYQFLAFPGDEFQVKYIQIGCKESSTQQSGIGIIIRKTSAQWIPQSHVVYAIISEVDPKTHEYLPAVNPF